MKEVLEYTEKSIVIDGFQFAMKIWGTPDGIPVLALHGWLDNANTFDKIAPIISDGLHLVAIDLAGHGKSDHRASGNSYYIWDYAIDILRILEFLDWKKFSILAHSLGTGIASIIAGSKLVDIDKIICIDGLGVPFVTEDEQVVSGFRKAYQQLKMAKKTNFFDFKDAALPKFKSIEEAVEDRRNNSISTISYEASEILIRRSIYEVSGGYRSLNDPMVMLHKPYRLTEIQAQQFITSMTCETLVILGEQGMFADGLFADRIQKFKKASVHWLSGGHHLHLEEAHQQISILINQFLNKKQY